MKSHKVQGSSSASAPGVFIWRNMVDGLQCDLLSVYFSPSFTVCMDMKWPCLGHDVRAYNISLKLCPEIIMHGGFLVNWPGACDWYFIVCNEPDACCLEYSCPLDAWPDLN